MTVEKLKNLDRGPATPSEISPGTILSMGTSYEISTINRVRTVFIKHFSINKEVWIDGRVMDTSVQGGWNLEYSSHQTY